MKLTESKRNNIIFLYTKDIFSLLVIRYSLDEFRRIFVDENTLIESIEPIMPKQNENNQMEVLKRTDVNLESFY